MSKFVTTGTVTLTGTSGSFDLPVDLSNAVAGALFFSTTTDTTGIQVSLTVYPVNPTTGNIVPGLVGSTSLYTLDTNTQDGVYRDNQMYYDSAKVNWSSSAALTSRVMTVTFVAAPSVTVTVTT